MLVPAAFGQLLAALAASALAAVDSYGTAAGGFAVGGIAGLITFAALANGHGIVALAWGLAVNAAVSFAIPVASLLRRRALVGPRAERLDVLPRLGICSRVRRYRSHCRAATYSRFVSPRSSASGA